MVEGRLVEPAGLEQYLARLTYARVDWGDATWGPSNFLLTLEVPRPRHPPPAARVTHTYWLHIRPSRHGAGCIAKYLQCVTKDTELEKL